MEKGNFVMGTLHEVLLTFNRPKIIFSLKPEHDTNRNRKNTVQCIEKELSNNYAFD